MMFEKEAKEYADKVYGNRTEMDHYGIAGAFADGAEFGYYKANEWHYPSKGEYPNECENVWCYCKGMGIKFCCVGHIIIGGDNKVRWWANSKSEELNVIAWKEIVPPKLEG